MMEITTKEASEETLIIYINGEITNQDADQLRRIMTSREQKNMIIQLSMVSFICSLAIAMLVMGVKQCDGRNGNFILCQTSKDFQSILEAVGLFDVFILMETEAAALKYIQDKEEE